MSDREGERERAKEKESVCGQECLIFYDICFHYFCTFCVMIIMGFAFCWKHMMRWMILFFAANREERSLLDKTSDVACFAMFLNPRARC